MFGSGDQLSSGVKKWSCPSDFEETFPPNSRRKGILFPICQEYPKVLPDSVVCSSNRIYTHFAAQDIPLRVGEGTRTPNIQSHSLTL